VSNLTELATQAAPEPSQVMHQIGMLNLRISDMMTQLNAVMKALIDENGTLKKENADLKNKQDKASKH
jgi:regulator of replication initiation timing